MSSITNNQAAWIMEKTANPLKIGLGPTPDPQDDEVVIKVAYAAVNPTDWGMQDTPYLEEPYPFIFGCDVAGTVAQLGPNASRFKIGQRVIGHCDNLLSQKPSHAGFQLYTTCQDILVAAIPDSMPLANAAVLPLSISTGAAGLFHILKLTLPSLDPKPVEKKILIWGGSSSCGSTAIQLAVAAGLTVVTTASAKNHEYVKSLGASYAFDHKDPKVVEKILEILKPGDLVLDSIGLGTDVVCGEILGKIGGGILPTVRWPVGPYPENVKGVLVNGGAPAFADRQMGDAVWRKYIPAALAAGKLQAKPDPMIVKGGLEKVQEGIDLLRKGVSATKIVIEISKA